MALSKKIIAGGIAVLALLGTAGAAMAAPAFATSNVNVRSGPGTSYGVIDTLRRGEPVDVQYCQGSWCFVDKRGPDGWVSANYLDRGGPPVWNPPPPPPPVWGPPPPPPPPAWGPPPPPPPVWDGPGYYPPRPPRPPHWNPRPPRPQPWPGNTGGSVCVNGPNGYFCVGS